MPPPRKRLKTTTVEEITFDPSAREEYLTGFHKRKLERAKHAQEIAKEKERQEKIEERRQLREQRAQDLEKHVETVNAMIRKANGEESDEEGSADEDGDEDAEWGGIEEAPVIAHEDEYVDEDKYTTVTVEAVDITKDGFVDVEGEQDEDAAEVTTKVSEDAAEGTEQSSGKRKWTKEKPARDKDKTKKKKVKFRYESKAERKVTREKQRNKGRSQARARREKQ